MKIVVLDGFTLNCFKPFLIPKNEDKALEKPSSESMSGRFGNISTLISLSVTEDKSVPNIGILSLKTLSEIFLPIKFNTSFKIVTLLRLIIGTSK